MTASAAPAARHPFRRAIEAGDLEAALDLLALDVTFHSPVLHRPVDGRAAVERLLRAVVRVFEDFRYVDELGDEADAVLRFRARVGTREVEGVDLVMSDAAGRITDFTVMVRPLSGLQALAEAMLAELSAGAEPAGGGG